MSNSVFAAIHAFLGLSLKKEWDKGTKKFVFLPLSETHREGILKGIQNEGILLKELYQIAAKFFGERSIFLKHSDGDVAEFTFQKRYDLEWEIC